MSKETKSNGQKDELDRFYTNSDTVEICLKEIDIGAFNIIIEPSAGCGSFSKKIPNCIAYDIMPAADNIIQADWFTVDKAQFIGKALVIGNPPFGQQNTLAIRFFNESAKFADTIAFILPLSFKKDSLQNQLNLNFHLIKEIELPNNDFYLKNSEKIKVPCVFQIWQKQTEKRKPKKLKTTTALFSFVNKEQADFRIQRVGGNAGKASLDLNFSAQSNYFIKNNTELSNKEFIDIVNNAIFPTINYTVGPKSLSKGELIAVLEDIIFNK